MKKFLYIILLCALTASLCACRDTEIKEPNNSLSSTDSSDSSSNNSEVSGVTSATVSGNNDDDNSGDDNPSGEEPGEEDPNEENPGNESPGGDDPGNEGQGGQIPGGAGSGNQNPSGQNPSTETPEVAYDVRVSPGQTLTVKSGEVLTIPKGKTYLVDGKIECGKGGSIIIENGGGLYLNGEMDLSGELRLNGFLEIRKNAVIDGSGVLTVCDSFDDINCIGSVYAKINPPAPVVTNGVTTIGGIVIANKKITLPPDYGDGLTDDTLAALAEMRVASGFPMSIRSGFRDYYTQQYVFNYWCTVYGEAQASRISARAGTSEHQTGLTMDITSTDDSYGDTAEAAWLGEHCYEYGFIIRYPKGKEAITGYTYEPWHVRYLGKSSAKLVHDSGLTLEEFLGVEG